MCMTSTTGDYWANTFPQRWPDIGKIEIIPGTIGPLPASQNDIAALRAEVKELRKLLLASKKFDEATGQPDCEMGEKVALIKAIAKMVGVDMKDIFPE